jgi:phosphoribosylanthranilate isomerase
LEDAILAIKAGADMLGFYFHPPSPRSISIDECSAITARLVQDFPDIIRIGVFVNKPVPQIHTIFQDCQLNLIQLHGDETADSLPSFHGKAFKAFRGIPEPTTYMKFISATSILSPAFLLDATVAGIFGGSGIKADWSGASKLAQQFSILLAGGITPANVVDAIHQVSPWGVDTASGIESSPGKKDFEKMVAFVKAVRSAEYMKNNEN